MHLGATTPNACHILHDVLKYACDLTSVSKFHITNMYTFHLDRHAVPFDVSLLVLVNGVQRHVVPRSLGGIGPHQGGVQRRGLCRPPNRKLDARRAQCTLVSAAWRTVQIAACSAVASRWILSFLDIQEFHSCLKLKELSTRTTSEKAIAAHPTQHGHM